MVDTGIRAQQANTGNSRDGVCCPVICVLPTVTFLNHVETMRTGQHAPSGLGFVPQPSLVS